MLRKIISGAQTGVDRAALDAAMLLGFEYGGWCPKGRLDEKGKIPEKYNYLKEISGEFKTDKENYNTRTRKNIEDSDATLIIVPKIPLPEKIKDGTLLTIDHVKKQKKPYLIVDLSKSTFTNSELITTWVKEHAVNTLNIAGPRESTCPGIYQATLGLLEITLPKCKNCFSLRAKL
jgi:hypothetical protein